MQNVKFSVPNMKCDGCANAVRSALSKLESVKRAEVSLDAKTVSVSIDDASPVQTLIDAIAAVGYRASLID